MKITRLTMRTTAAILFLLVPVIFPIHDILGRAGRGESYRSSSSGSSSGSSWRSSSSRDSSSWYRSSSSSTSGSSSSSSSRPSSSSSSSSSGSSSGAVVNDYDIYFTVKSWSCVLNVNRDGSVDATETYDVDINRPMKGIKRPIYNTAGSGNVLITDVKCPQGQADSISQFGYKDQKVTGRHVFTLQYHAVGMVVPSRTGSRFQWQPLFGENMKVTTFKVVLPEGASPIRTGVSQADQLNAAGKGLEIQHTVAGNVIIIPHDLSRGALNLTVDLPAGIIDAAALKAGLARVFEKYPFPPVLDYRSRVTVNSDRTVDREESFTADPDSGASFMIMDYQKKFESSYSKDKKDTLYGKVSVSNNLYLYRLGITTATGGNYYSKYVSLPLEKKGRTVITYSMWGNFNSSEPFFFDFRFPPTDLKKTERVHFEIVFPPFVKKEEVKIQLLLMNGYFSGNSIARTFDENPYNDNTSEPVVLREAEFASRWVGNRLIGEYPEALYGEQFLLAKVFLPGAGFSEPGAIKKTWIRLSNFWYFDRMTFLVMAAIIAGAAGSLFGIIAYRRKKAAAERSRPSPLYINQKAADEIRAEDPVFSPEAFLERSRIIAEKIQEAWSRGSMTQVRNFVSQGVYNRFNLQLRLMREQEKVENLIGDYTVRSVSLTGSSLSHAYQTLHVHIDASARDVIVPVSMADNQKRQILERSKKTYFTEVYSFTRKRGAVTDATKNILAGQCPSCGSVPDAFGDTNKCKSCGTIYNSGEFDWVLSEITQASEWKEGSAQEVPGLAALEKENISLNRTVIEDRASCLFWRWIASQAAGSRTPLLRDGTERFLGAFNPPAGYFAETAVGSVDLKEAGTSGGTATASVLVLWSSAIAAGKVPEHREHLFTLTLPLQTKNPYGLADHSCDSCGAPLPESDAGTCSYCGGALQKINSDWLLDAVAERK